MASSPTSEFLVDKAYIDGQWVPAASGKTFQVTNPSNGSLIGSVPDMNEEDAAKAVEAAYKAFQSWKKVSPVERSNRLRKWYELIMANQEELAKVLTLEMGKTIPESKGEVWYGGAYVEWFSAEARRIYGDTVESPAPSKRMIVIKQPLGVATMITPWNFPMAMITRHAAPAIAAGCTVVLKPAEDTPYSALALCQLAEKAGFPPGLLNVVTASRDHAPAVGKVLSQHPLVAKVSFTGSTAVGKGLLKQAADGVKRVSLELGGNGPFIVFDSADVDKAVAGLMMAKFGVAGQTCVCANRVLVQEGIHDRFVKAVSEVMAKRLKVGDGMDASSTMGPLINKRAVDKVAALVDDAKAAGATVVVGGKKPDLGGNFYEPTLLTGVNATMRCAKEEIFGPVAPVLKFKTEEEAIAIANGTTSGLAGYFYSNDISQCWRVAEQLEYGMIGINEGMAAAVEAPFGGVKESGLGREGSKYGIEEFLELKTMCFGNI